MLAHAPKMRMADAVLELMQHAQDCIPQAEQIARKCEADLARHSRKAISKNGKHTAGPATRSDRGLPCQVQPLTDSPACPPVTLVFPKPQP
jgi:hypothetical protein